MNTRRTNAKIGLVVAVAAGACALFGGARLALSRATTTVGSTSLEARRPGRLDPQLHVPHVSEPIRIDAEMDGKKVWESAAGSTLNLKDSAGKGMVPYTEVKARWGDGKLYFLLYAGDLDLEGNVTQADGPVSKDDSFHIELGGRGGPLRVVEVSVLGTVADALCPPSENSAGPADVHGHSCDRTWQSHAAVAVDRDGTLNRLGDNDEEWVVEMALPLSALGIPDARPGSRIPFAVRRCEVGAGGPGACGSWGMGAERGELILDP
jgi:hypothetical protein